MSHLTPTRIRSLVFIGAALLLAIPVIIVVPLGAWGYGGGGAPAAQSVFVSAPPPPPPAPPAPPPPPPPAAPGAPAGAPGGTPEAPPAVAPSVPVVAVVRTEAQIKTDAAAILKSPAAAVRQLKVTRDVAAEAVVKATVLPKLLIGLSKTALKKITPAVQQQAVVLRTYYGPKVEKKLKAALRDGKITAGEMQSIIKTVVKVGKPAKKKK